MNRGPRGFHGRPRPSVKNLKRTIKTLLRYILKDHPVALFVVIICIIIGSLSGVVIAILAETLKTTIHNKKELEDLVSEYGYKVIGEIPQITSNKGVI